MTPLASSLDSFAALWKDAPEVHAEVVRTFTEALEADPDLHAHRLHIQQHALGCGAPAFHWLWNLAFEDWRARCTPVNQPHEWSYPPYRFLEIGVFRGQVISLMRLLAQRAGVASRIVGVSTFDGRGMLWDDLPAGYTDFPIVSQLFQYFSLEPATLIIADCLDPRTATLAGLYAPYDAVYIDAEHTYEAATADLQHYAPLVKPGGLLFGDDSGNFLKLPPGQFPGFEACSRAFEDWWAAEPAGRWTHLGNVMHLRVWRKA